MMHLSDDASLRPNTSRIPAGDITATIGGTSFRGSQLDSGDRTTGITDRFLTGVESADQLHQLTQRKGGIARRERQPRHVDGGRDLVGGHGACQFSTWPLPAVITVPGITRSRYGASRSTANCSEVGGPSFHIGMTYGS